MQAHRLKKGEVRAAIGRKGKIRSCCLKRRLRQVADYETKTGACQKWDSNPRLHSETRIPSAGKQSLSLAP